MTHWARWIRGWAFVLLALQALGGGTVALAHAQDVLDAPAAFEASHDGRCAILHDGPRCALCQYAGIRVVTPQAFVLLMPPVPRAGVARSEPLVAAAGAFPPSPPSRAPPVAIS